MSLVAPASGEVHVWQHDLDIDTKRVERLAALLNLEETRKAAAFRSPVDRARFQVAHGMVREILGEYLALEPQEIQFAVNQWGKPHVVLQPPDAALHFNLAHSHQQMLLAVCRREVGVDIEHFRPGLDVRGIAANYFSTEEVAVLNGASDIEAVFLRCWTAKEAVIKGVGVGLSLPLGSFVTLVNEQSLVKGVRVSPDDCAAADLHLYALEAGAGYFGALAVRADADEPRWRVVRKTGQAMSL